MFQFSLRSLLIFMAVVACVVWVLFAPPDWIGLLVLQLAYVALPPLVLAGIIFHSGYWRAFFVGAAPWAFIAIYRSSDLLLAAGMLPSFVSGSVQDVKLSLFWPLAITFFSGLVAVGVRWWAVKVQNSQDHDDQAE